MTHVYHHSREQIAWSCADFAGLIQVPQRKAAWIRQPPLDHRTCPLRGNMVWPNYLSSWLSSVEPLEASKRKSTVANEDQHDKSDSLVGESARRCKVV